MFVGLAAEAAHNFGASDALSTLLTVESFLFASLSLGTSLAGGTPYGRVHLVPPRVLGAIATAILVLLAVGALGSWFDLFTGSGWPSDTAGVLWAISLLIGIVTQPCIAVVIAVGLWRT